MIGETIPPLGYLRLAVQNPDSARLRAVLPAEWPVLPPGSADCWLFELGGDLPLQDALWNVLSREETTRAGRFATDTMRARYVCTRGILRHVLGGYLKGDPADLDLVLEPGGKPFLEGDARHRELCFNLSHAGNLLLIACTWRRRVGADVETINTRHRVQQLAARFFHVDEVRRLDTAAQEQVLPLFFRCWTWKEAYAKALGLGLRMELSSSNMAPLLDAEGPVVKDIGGHEWLCLALHPVPNAVASVMIERTPSPASAGDGNHPGTAT